MEETQTKAEDWLNKELEELETKSFDGEKKPGLQFVENQIVEFTIDYSEPFPEWYDQENKTTKAMIPCKKGEVECIWWLNKKNPVYKDVIRACRNGRQVFKILQTGKGQSTRYTLVDEGNNTLG